MKRFSSSLLAVAAALVLFSGCSGLLGSKKSDAYSDVLDVAHEKYLASARALDPADGFPRRVVNGTSWETTPAEGWTSGFYPGVLWYLYEESGDRRMLEQARRWTEPLEELKTFTGHHDLGFMVYNSFGHGYRLTRDPEYKEILLQTARSLASRYNPTVGAIKSWDGGKWTYPVIIDNMMNLELLFWAAKNGGDKSLYNLAVQHARTSQREHVRQDGSTFHVIDFDPNDGKVIQKKTHQGYSDASAWARGQAWGLYGFTMTYRETKEPEFLRTAQRIADRFLERMPADHVPFWDFDDPAIPNTERDASAGAIAASGLIELSHFTTDPVRKEAYRKAASDILTGLTASPFMETSLRNPSLLQHSVGSKPHNSEVDAAIIYGDYYLVEALMRVLGETELPWKTN